MNYMVFRIQGGNMDFIGGGRNDWQVLHDSFISMTSSSGVRTGILDIQELWLILKNKGA